MINIDSLNDDEKLAALESIHKSIAESKEIQKKKITTNVEMILKALKKIEGDLKQRYDETGNLIANLKNGTDGRDGKEGRDGKDGRAGKDGAMGPRGYDGLPGRNGLDGEDGVSITDAHIDFDGSLIISLSSGRVINVGEVVTADIAERIKVITNGGGTSQYVLDTLASLQSQISAISSGLEYQGTWNASTNVPALASSVGTAGYYYIVATAGSTNLNGITDWQIGDWAVFNGTVWQKIDQSNLVTSVAGRTGAIVLTTADIGGLGTIATQASSNVSITGGSITGITDLAIADGGTGQSTAAAAITALTGTQTSGYYLRSNGTNSVLAAIVAADVPTLNQNTTGTAANVTGTVAIANGGTGQTTANTAFNALAPSQTGNSGKYLTTNGTDTSWATNASGTVTSVAASVPTFLSVSGSPITTSGTLAITLSGTALPTANGGTGLTSFTLNSVPYATSTSVLTSDSALMFNGSSLSITASNSGFLGLITQNTSAGVTATSGSGYLNNISAGSYLFTYGSNNTLSVFGITAGDYTGILSDGASSNGILFGSLTNKPIVFGVNNAEQMRLTTTGLGIGTTAGSKLDVKGTLRLSGSTSGYVGLAPAAAAGSTTYTLPSADGTSGQSLTTNGSGTLSWASGSSGTVTSVAASVPTFLSVTGSPITTSGTLAITLSGTALPVANGGTGITSFGTGVATFLGTPSSANLASSVTDETGSGALVFATSPTLVTPALGTPSSGVVTNLTGTASININGTVGATTATTGAFTTLTASSTLTVTGAGSIEGLTVGRGAGAVATNTAVGASALVANTTGYQNASFGYVALQANTTGYNNAAFGEEALYLNTTGALNTGIGQEALRTNTTGSSNVAVGAAALRSNTTASNNTAVGYQAGYSNVTGTLSVFVGYQAGYTNTASYNTFVGNAAGKFNTTGTGGSFFGSGSGVTNTTGSYNTFYGNNSGAVNSTGSNNVAIGGDALVSNTTASNNTAVGYQAGYANTTGTRNTFVGISAGAAFTTGSYNAAFGSYAMQGTTSTNNTAIGDFALQQLTTGGFNTAIGNGSGYLITTGAKNTIVGLYNGNQGGLDIRTSSGYVVLSDGDGNPLVKVQNNASLSLQGAAVVGGIGISFPATQSASSDANTLDDYEEGTWTMGVSFGGGTTGITYNASYVTGSYTKIGNRVFISGVLVLTNKGSSSGDALLTGLPFTSSSSGSGASAFPMVLYNATYTGQQFLETSGGTTTAYLWQVSALGVRSSLTNTNFANDSQITVGGSYVI